MLRVLMRSPEQIVDEFFPTAPADVVAEWLLPLAKRLGHPSLNPDRWFKNLRQPLQRWASATWLHGSVGLMGFDLETQIKVLQVLEPFRNPTLPEFTDANRSRVASAVAYITAHGRMPGLPVVVHAPPSRPILVDGHHRWAARVHVHGQHGVADCHIAKF